MGHFNDCYAILGYMKQILFRGAQLLVGGREIIIQRIKLLSNVYSWVVIEPTIVRYTNTIESTDCKGVSLLQK